MKIRVLETVSQVIWIMISWLLMSPLITCSIEMNNLKSRHLLFSENVYCYFQDKEIRNVSCLVWSMLQLNLSFIPHCQAAV